jgi:predicted metal-binding membrane protein
MASSTSSPMPRARNLILALLLILAAAAWAVLIWQSRMAGEQMMGLTMGMEAPLFLASWISMMVAMMFPTAAPMILMFARVSASRQQRGQTFVPTWVFVSAYLVVWTLFGMVAYLVALGGTMLAEQSMALMEHATRIGGVVLILAGLYQLSPLKHTCLSTCRSPLAFIMTSWREGYWGAFQMGLEHGAYCLGCCWLLFVLLFPLGMMNVAAMAAITLLIFAEKALPLGRQIGWVAGPVLIAYGVLVIFVPTALPTMV